jgi:hypothetical protein
MPTPAPIQPRIQNQLAQSERVSRLPRERDLLDPDEVSGVEYGSSKKKKGAAGAKKTGTAALTIPLNEGGGGGLNV